MQADSTVAPCGGGVLRPAERRAARAWVCAFAGLWLFASAGAAHSLTTQAPGTSLPAVPEASRLDFATLLTKFAAIPGFSAPFREEKRLSLLREPLLSHGSIYYAPPQRLARVIDEPAASRVVVDGERLTYSSADERGSIGLDAHPTLRIFVDSLRMLLRGDENGLRATFHITFSNVGPPEALSWTVVLEPRSDSLRHSLASIRIEGQDRSLRVFQILERNGDVTRMTFSSAATERRFTDREAAEIFGTPGP